MSFAIPVAILGFTPFERSTFEAFLRLAARRTPAYELHDDPFSADFVIVDADDPVLVNRVRASGCLPRSVLLGASAHPGAALHLARPFNLMQLVRSLDGLVRPVRTAPGEAAEPPPAPGLFAPRAAIRIPLPAESVSLLATAGNPSRGWPAGLSGP
ncbi:MAG: hypothetical protein RJA10_350 [Pseudomonadota bacterium]|jgi:two-component system, cell cycle response regulator